MATTSTTGALRGQPRGPVQDLEDLLHCGICFDYFNIAMIIPQCSHNYCSLCIRKFLSYKTQCPTCCVTVTEPELRNNRLLDDLVKAFISARERLCHPLMDSSPQPPQDPSTAKRATRGAQECPGKEIKQENKSMDKFLVKTNAKISKRSSRAGKESAEDAAESSRATSRFTTSVKQEPGVMNRSSEEAFVPSTPSTSMVKVKVECPVCGVGILEQYINNHLDSCLTSDEKKESLRSSLQKRKPMAKVVYNLLSERDLRKRLKEVGLSAQGSKQQMVRRHQEFLHMYNAQCDSLNPKSAAEIVTEIEKNEKVRSALGTKQENGMTFTKDQSEEQIDQIHQDYRRKHKTEFQQLIEQMKRRWKTPKRKSVKEEPMGCDDTDNFEQQNQVEVMEASTPNHHPLLETEEHRSPSTEKPSVFRSSSPVFPLSPVSRASSSSDILRDIEEATEPEAFHPSLDQPGHRRRRSKVTSSFEASSKPQTSRSKRQRK
ncbi:E3 ubiquitin-protein ligase RAD18 isoform X2 [Dendrobates tinctorius]|uniref:E3 ubiquitin-protein ligase RAD18 isoform X2 n=1 Tax=Dendrobates tinctorius TaxID=92724 RepID=UPI003CCA06BD